MIRRASAIYLFFFQTLVLTVAAQVQPPQVPSKMEFAGIELKIDDDAKKLIQASVLSLTRNQRYFQSKVERANIYFPVIERILNEEGVPEDFKYLVLQESELVPDAVSSSNAVGYWQFKKEAASDMNVLVNSEVDERMHIVTATRGAVRYLKKNNIYLSNWISALLSYNLGLGGVKLVVDQSDMNATSMRIKGTTHIYILKFLAHKISFENALKLTPPQLTLLEYKNCKNKTIKDVAEELGVLEQDLIKYNLWLKARKIPDDGRHSVIVPANETNYERLLALVGSIGDTYAIKEPTTGPAVFTKLTSVNNLKAILAGNAETIESLAKKGGISKARFIKYNELEKGAKIISGQIYYLQTKKNKADNDYHVAEENETYWNISQKHGIKKSRLLRFNRIAKNEKLQVGRVLWIAETRPIIVPVEIKAPVKQITKQEVKVVANPDKKDESKVTSAEKTGDPEMFPDEFYDEKNTAVPVTTVSSIPQVESSASLNKTHVVTKGETFYSISKLYGVQIAALKKWNDLNDETPLKIGQTLVIKSAESVGDGKETSKSADYITYTVKTGDSIYKIAKDHKVTIKQIQEWNNKVDYNISIGEELKIQRN